MISSRSKLSREGWEIICFLKFRQTILELDRISVTQHSTGLSLGNQVDGLPSAQHLKFEDTAGRAYSRFFSKFWENSGRYVNLFY